jgi:hypothetical protein
MAAQAKNLETHQRVLAGTSVQALRFAEGLVVSMLSDDRSEQRARLVGTVKAQLAERNKPR